MIRRQHCARQLGYMLVVLESSWYGTVNREVSSLRIVGREAVYLQRGLDAKVRGCQTSRFDDSSNEKGFQLMHEWNMDVSSSANAESDSSSLSS
jgi:hypothetical protein